MLCIQSCQVCPEALRGREHQLLSQESPPGGCRELWRSGVLANKQGQLIDYVQMAKGYEWMNEAWVFDALITSYSYTRNNIWWGRMTSLDQSATSVRRQYEQLPGQDKNKYLVLRHIPSER